MSEITVNPSDLTLQPISQLAALPHAQLQEFDVHLNELMAWAKQARERLNAALEQRYGEAARAALLASGRDFGAVHLSDGPLKVSFELPKRVSWDQPQLTAIAERITASGESIKDYLDIEFSVSESRFNNWPPALKEQ